MNEQGLAQAMGGQPQVEPQMIEQVMMLLAQGVTPEELVEKGVPEEVIRAAMEMMQGKMQAKQMEGGLASMATQGTNI